MTVTALEVPLTQGLVTLVDAADYERVVEQGKWSAMRNTTVVYAHRAFRSTEGRLKWIYLHTFLTGWPLVDHRNGDGLDNRRSNLRLATTSQNAANRRLSLANKSGFKGVSRTKSGSWRAVIKRQGVARYLGAHATPEDAARAYDRAALELFGDFARTNFPRSEYGR